VYVVDGAHYTERVFNCKPLLIKKPGNFTSGAITGSKEGSKGNRKAIQIPEISRFIKPMPN